MKVRYQHTADDLGKLYRLAQPRGDSSLAKAYWYYFLPAEFALMAIVSSFAFATTFTLLLLGTAEVFSLLAKRAAIKAALSPENMGAALLPQMVSLSEEGVRFECDADEIFLRWRWVRAVKIWRGFLRFEGSRFLRHCIPLSAFFSVEEKDAFVAFAKACLEKATAER